jgi:hypothetical protein
MRVTARPISAVLAAALLVAAPAGAATDKQLVAVRGTSGYQPTAAAPFRRVVSRQLLADDNIAVTQPASNALVVLPDSSEVALGAATSVQVGAFNDPQSTTPTTVTLKGGALRFNVRHPDGARTNYVFTTATSQIAVRGTIALYKTGPDGDVISCLQCAPGDATVTVSGQTFPLLSGQTLFVSPTHAVTTSSDSAAPGQAFAGTGLATNALSQFAFTEEVEAGVRAAAQAAAAAADTTTAAAVAGAAVIGTAAAAGFGNAVPTHTTAPTVTGSATITGSSREPAATPAPSPTRPPH